MRSPRSIAMVGGQAPAPVDRSIPRGRAPRSTAARGAATRDRAVVVIRGDRIETAGSRRHRFPRTRASSISGGATLLPGLIDLHTHLTSTGVHWEDELLKTTPGAGGAVRRAQRAGHADGRLHDVPRHGPDLAVHRHRSAEGDRRGRRARSAAARVAGNYVSPTGGAGDARQFSIFVDVPIVQKPRRRPGRSAQGRPHQSEAGRRLHQDPRHRRGAVEGQRRPARSSTPKKKCASPSRRRRAGASTSPPTLHGTDGIKAGIRAGVHTIDHGSMMDDEARRAAENAPRVLRADAATRANRSRRTRTSPSPRRRGRRRSPR